MSNGKQWLVTVVGYPGETCICDDEQVLMHSIEITWHKKRDTITIETDDKTVTVRNREDNELLLRAVPVDRFITHTEPTHF